MKMTIDEAIRYYEDKNVVLTEEEALANTIAINTMRKYQQFQADYENRLKADMVAMLTEIQLEIEEVRLERPLMSRGHECYGFEDKTPTEIRQECSDVIQQKINALKGDQEGKQ